MPVRHIPHAGPRIPARADLEALLRPEADGVARWWSNDPGERYGWHAHGYRKVLYCSEGSITFHTREGDLTLGPGDRLDVDPQTEHAATVGPDGVTCVEVGA